MQLKPALLALGLAISAAPLSAQMNPRDPSDRRTTQGTIGDIIFGSGTANTTESCRVRDARTPDGRIVQICDPAYENRRDGKGRRSHVNDRDGDGDFDANDRAIRKREHQLQKQQRKSATQQQKLRQQRMKDARIHG